MAEGGATGKGFKKGKSGNPGGKFKATGLSSRTEEAVRKAQAIEAFGNALMTETATSLSLAPLRPLRKGEKYTIEELLMSRPYMEGVVMRMRLGTAPHLEKFVWEHVFGKAIQTLRIEKPPESPMAKAMKELKPEEIRVLAQAAARVIELRKAAVIEVKALPSADPTK